MVKLFGMMIEVIPNKDEDIIVSATNIISSHHTHLSSSTTNTCHDTKGLAQCNHAESIKTEEEEVEQANEEPRTPTVDEQTTIAERGTPTTLSGIGEDPETSSVYKEFSFPDTHERDVSNDTGNSDEKTLKNLDKLLPCPRCSSMDTKFCYYNNYNVSQPRHLCKKCQRYWTAGGTMRIVPVGSGRRKNKCSPTSQYGHINVSEALQAARTGAANGISQLNGSLLAFGSDSHQCESVASAMIDVDKSENYGRNRCFEDTGPRIPFSYGTQEIGDDNSSGSSCNFIYHNEEVLNTGVESKLINIKESPTQVPCFPVPPWASPWNTAEWRSATQPAFSLPGFPISVCTSGQLSVSNPGPNSQTLGKHPRDGSRTCSSELEKVETEKKNLKRQVLTPKTLRIHNPTEAAQSSIWLTLGIKNEHIKTVNEASLRKAFCANSIQKNHMTKASMVLQENPAALLRSYNFLETF